MSLELVKLPLKTVLDWKRFTFDFFGRGIILEGNYTITLYVPNIPSGNILSLVERNKACGITVRFWKLPWYKCWFERIQHQWVGK